MVSVYAYAVGVTMTAYRRPMPSTWWLGKRSYLLFMLRELTAVLIAAFWVLQLVGLWELGRGAQAYAAFLDRLASPGWVVFHLLALVAAFYHSITWFNLTPKVMVVWRGEERVSPFLIAGSNYAAWFVVSGILLWMVLGG